MLAFRLRGEVDIGHLEKAFSGLVRRHEALRTTFVSQGGELAARVHSPPATWEIDFDDLSVFCGDPTEELGRRLAAEAARPFDLTAGPLLRASLFRLAPGELTLAVSVHRIAADAWSIGVIFKELSALYNAHHAGVSSPLPEVSLPYSDFVERQNERQAHPDIAAELATWKDRLAGVPPLELPTDRPRPAVQSHRGASFAFSLPPALVAALSQVGQARGAGLSTTLLAAFHTLLSRYSGQSDITVGVPAGRGQPELASLVGRVENTLVIRADLSGDPAFSALVTQVKDRSREAEASRELPFERIVEALFAGGSAADDLSRSPLFQVSFDLETAPSPGLELKGARADRLEIPTKRALFDLALSLRDEGEGLAGLLEYNTDLYDARTISAMATHFRVLLEDIARSPDRRVSELALLTAEEKRRLLVEWNDTPSFPDTCCVHELFEAQVERTPGATALIVGRERLSYRELSARANRLAHYLRERGVGPEVRVGLCLRRTTEILVAILGVLKAGGAYLPLDPTYPKDRLTFTLADAGAPVLLTETSLQGRLDTAAAEVIHIDQIREALAKQPETNPPKTAGPWNLAYTMYTSGSTGRPKGIAVEHRSSVVFVRWCVDTYRREDYKGTLACASIGFDPSVLEIFAPLACGGAVILAENGLALPSLPAKDEVTMVTTVPCVMTELVRQGAIPSSVKIVNLAGEPLARSLVRAILEPGTVNDVYNLYGPTECTTYSTYTAVPKDTSAEPTIGKQLRGDRVYILDKRMQPVPIGVQGEIYVGGVGPARGYLGRPALTAEKFVPDPFSEAPGARLYRSGDRARHLPDGDIVFLGRIDFQVKVRGFRIELGEIEAVLREQPHVEQVMILAIEDGLGDRRLVGYLVPQAGKQIDVAEVTRTLEKRLPAYMVPSAFVVLDAMPLTSNGKVDRKALPVPDAAKHVEGAFQAARTSTEKLVAELFGETLGVEKVSALDDFFLLGGDSIKVTRLLAALRSRLGVSLSPVAVFEARTVMQVAQRIDEAKAGAAKDGAAKPGATPAAPAPGDEPSIVALQQSGSKQPLFLMHPYSGMPYAYTNLTALFDPDRPLYGSMVVLEKEHHFRTYEERTALYVREIKRLQPRGPYLLGGYSYGARLAFEAARQLALEGDAASHLILFDGAPPSPSKATPLMVKSAELTREVAGRVWPPFRVVYKLESQMTCAPPSREELVSILTSPWFPGRLGRLEAEVLSMPELADRLLETLRKHAFKGFWYEVLNFTPSWMVDGLGRWRCIKIRKLNSDLLQGYAPTWKFPAASPISPMQRTTG